MRTINLALTDRMERFSLNCDVPNRSVAISASFWIILKLIEGQLRAITVRFDGPEDRPESLINKVLNEVNDGNKPKIFL